MFCKQCGHQNADSSAFCISCGSALNAAPPAAGIPPQQQPAYQQPHTPQQPAYQQPYAPQPSSKKKKTGLIVGLIAGGVVLLAAAAFLLYFFVFSGTPAEGIWYHAQRGWAISFKDNQALEMHTLTGRTHVPLQYDKGSAQGSFTADGTSYDFLIKEERLALVWSGGQAVFEKADNNANIEKLVLRALEGVWVNEESVEALSLELGKATLHMTDGNHQGRYTYSINNSSGTLSIEGLDYTFWATHEQLDFGDAGIYKKADSGFDIETFLSESGSSIEGIWYDAMGQNGTITFFADGYADIVSYGETYYATYTFDKSSNTGTISLLDEIAAFYLWGNILEFENSNYTREYVEQLGAEALISPLSGLWYESTGMLGTLFFSDDGVIEAYKDGVSRFGTYTYDRQSGTGQYILDNDSLLTVYLITYVDATDSLIVNGYLFTRDYVEPQTQDTGIIGTWYSMTGEFGIFVFDAYGGYTLEISGLNLQGTYTFDDSTNKGALTLTYMDETDTAQLSLENGILDVDGELFTREYVIQNTAY